MICNERVPFRLIQMPCCQHLFCNVNHRWPSFCPNCGAHVFPQIKGCALILDEDAWLKYDNGEKDNAKILGKRVSQD
jgi:hypothetical protein